MKLFSTIFGFILVVRMADAALFTNSLSADSLVRTAAPTLNYGGAGSLSISGSNATNGLGATNGVFDTFIRFNTAALVANFDSRFGAGNWVINGVKFQVTEMGASPNALFNRGVGAFEIRWIANDTWVEGTGTPMMPTTTGITYNNSLALLNNLMDVNLGTFTNSGVDGVLRFTLSLPAVFVDDLRAGGDVGFYLTAIDPGTGFTFNSRSFMTNSARPFVIVSAVARPALVEINILETNVTLTASNGFAGETYYVLTRTNVLLPRDQWKTVATNFSSFKLN